MDRKPDPLDDSDLLFSSPAPADPAPSAAQVPTRYPSDDPRDTALRQELETVRGINATLESVIASLSRAQSNVSVLSNTVDSASSLLETWTRILSQTEHNQRLILNPRWQGASQDLADLEAEAARKQMEAQRKVAEEAQRKEAAARKAAEEERRKAAAASRGSKGRGHARTGSRHTASASTGLRGVADSEKSSARGGSSTAGRSAGRTRGTRGRGAG
jgi:sugar-specific transcriptional regulator TrmB